LSPILPRQALPALRNASFVRFTLGRLCTILGWQMLGVAVGWHVYALTRDPLALGLIVLWEFLPFFLLVLVGGHTADHFNRRHIVIVTALVECSCALSLLWFALHGLARTWPVYAAMALFGATRAFWAPAMQAMLVNIVRREDLAPSVATDSMLRQIATVGGPVLGGVLYLLGPHIVYAACALLFLATALLTLSNRVQLPPSLRSDQPLSQRGHELLEGLRYVFRSRVVLACLSLDLFAVLFGGATALLPIFAADILRIGPGGLGLLRAGPAIGAGIVGLVLASRPLRSHAGNWLFGGVAVFGVATIVFGLSTSFWLSLAALIVAGAGDMVSVYVRLVLVQLNTPEAIRGRVSAVNSMFIGASNELGGFESGVTARWFGTVPSVLAGGIATLLVVALWRQWFPQLRRLPPLR
jgi:MFS family permease